MNARIGMLTVSATMALSGLSQAAVIGLIEPATRWRLENYTGDSLYVWYTGSKTYCNQGHLKLAANATASDRNRFWATVSTAKANDKKMMVYYESTTCTITSFGLAEE